MFLVKREVLITSVEAQMGRFFVRRIFLFKSWRMQQDFYTRGGGKFLCSSLLSDLFLHTLAFAYSGIYRRGKGMMIKLTNDKL